MSDLEINIALAQAMGWGKLNDLKKDSEVFCWNGQYWRQFDYRDPVIFVAICKHWKLVVNFDGYVSGMAGFELVNQSDNTCVEKSAALVVIGLANRGAK